MKTKYDINDEVLVRAKVCKIESYEKGIIKYALGIKGLNNYVYMTEEYIPYMYIG